MKGIVLAGGSGTRLRPLTIATSKQLLPIHDKPMIFYSISTLFLAGIRDIAIITNPEDKASFVKLLGDGKRFGANFEFIEQKKPNGIAEAFILAEEFIGDLNVALILGDNIFHGLGFGRNLAKFTAETEATILAYHVSDPSEFGVVVINDDVPVQLVEKPAEFISPYAVPGLYFYGNDVISRAKKIKPSNRGELEITTLNQSYLETDQLRVSKIPRGVTWFDGGTLQSLHDASEYVRVIENREGQKIGCLEEISWRNNWISTDDLRENAKLYQNTEYGDYLLRLSKECQ